MSGSTSLLGPPPGCLHLHLYRLWGDIDPFVSRKAVQLEPQLRWVYCMGCFFYSNRIFLWWDLNESTHPAPQGIIQNDRRFLIKQLIVINFWFLLLRPGLFPWQHPLLLLLGCSSFTQQVKPRAARAGWWSAFIFSGPSTKVSWGHQKPKGNYFSSTGLKVHRLLLGQLYGWPPAFNVQSSFL